MVYSWVGPLYIPTALRGPAHTDVPMYLNLLLLFFLYIKGLWAISASLDTRIRAFYSRGGGVGGGGVGV